MSPLGRCRRWGTASWHTYQALKAWVATTRATSAGSESTTARPRLAMPALHTTMSRWPIASTASATRRRHSSKSSTEAPIATARRPRPSMAATTSAAASASLR